MYNIKMRSFIAFEASWIDQRQVMNIIKNFPGLFFALFVLFTSQNTNLKKFRCAWDLNPDESTELWRPGSWTLFEPRHVMAKLVAFEAVEAETRGWRRRRRKSLSKLFLGSDKTRSKYKLTCTFLPPAKVVAVVNVAEAGVVVVVVCVHVVAVEHTTYVP